MKTFDGFLRRHLASLVLLATAAGFGMIIAELLMTRHTRGVQMIGVWAAVAGGVLALAGLLPWRAVRYGAAVLLLAVAASGVLGVYYHNGGEHERFGSAPVPPAIAATTTVQERLTPPTGGIGGDRGAPFGRRRNNAPLAPLALSGLAGLAMLAMVTRRPPTGDDAVPAA